MHSYRRTAIVRLVLFSEAMEGSLPLATEREFAVILTIDGVSFPAQNFQSPINDEQWRQFYARLRSTNTNHSPAGARDAAAIRGLCRQLYESLAKVSAALREFLLSSDARRLVLETTRPELHLLPWAAMVDGGGTFLAARDLSVVQCAVPFDPVAIATAGTLRLMTYLSQDTQRVTAEPLTQLSAEIRVIDGTQAFHARVPVSNIDIVHLEVHGDAVSNSMGDLSAHELGSTFGSVKAALLWSCSSGAVNSWGESAALNLHRAGAGLVVSFLTELHELDASSIAAQFYQDVFGPAASRDPETALVRIRAEKYKRMDEFPNANWASMTLYMRAPLDLSALPLNGPRVPRASWRGQDSAPSTVSRDCTADAQGVDVTAQRPGDARAAADAEQRAGGAAEAGIDPPLDVVWSALAQEVSKLQPGTTNVFSGFAAHPSETTALLPRAAFGAWRGNVIHLHGDGETLWAEILAELHIAAEESPDGDQADRLVWFFKRIESYGSPLIVWTDAAERHVNYLENISPPPTLTFLLLHGPARELTLPDLVNGDMLTEGRAACARLAEDCTDDLLSAAYFAFARGEDPTTANAYLGRIKDPAERLLLTANFISRRGVIPNPRPDWMLQHPNGRLTSLEQQQCQEDCFQRVIGPETRALRREVGRARHELGYLYQVLGKATTAEMLYSQALSDLEACPAEQRDFRWHDALSKTLRDWADLLARIPERLSKAAELLRRAKAIHAFHGRRLQIAYCLTTAARIALTGKNYSVAVQNAVDAANLFEALHNWRGWGEAMNLLFACLAETRETVRMRSLADLGIAKLEQSNLPDDKRESLRRAFRYQRANADWIAGRLDDARAELAMLVDGSSDPAKADVDPQFETSVKRLWHFLSTGPAK